jgi:hypothetical protein
MMIEYTVKVENDGTKWWFLNGQYHREDGPAIEYPDGTKSWYLNGQLHRVDGPAIEYASGTKWWCLNGQRHRTDGPAVEWADGTKWWYLNGMQMSEEEHARQTAPVKELPVADIEKLLGHKVKIVE